MLKMLLMHCFNAFGHVKCTVFYTTLWKVMCSHIVSCTLRLEVLEVGCVHVQYSSVILLQTYVHALAHVLYVPVSKQHSDQVVHYVCFSSKWKLCVSKKLMLPILLCTLLNLLCSCAYAVKIHGL